MRKTLELTFVQELIGEPDLAVDISYGKGPKPELVLKRDSGIYPIPQMSELLDTDNHWIPNQRILTSKLYFEDAVRDDPTAVEYHWDPAEANIFSDRINPTRR